MSGISQRYELVEPTSAEKLYLVLSVALATICFSGGLVQAAAQLHHRLTSCPQMALHLSHAAIAMLTAINVVYPIKSISQPPPARTRPAPDGLLGSHAGCLAFGAGLLLLTLTLTCLQALLQQTLQLLHSWPLLLPQTAGRLWPALVVLQWAAAATLAALPVAGWARWDGVCHLPAVLAPGYLALLVTLLGACCLLATGLLLATVWLRRRRAAPGSDSDQSPIGGAASRHYDSLLAKPPRSGLGLAATNLAAAALATLATLAAAMSADRLPPETSLSLLRWAALLLVLVNLFITMTTLFCDDALGSAVLAWLRAFCCCCHGNNVVHPVPTTSPEDPAHTELDDNFEI